MGKKRRSYERDFKLSAIKMVLEEGLSVSRVSRDLGISENTLHKWKKAYQEDSSHAFPGKGKMKPEEEELRKLKKELSTVTMERDILKKAIAFFAKEEG